MSRNFRRKVSASLVSLLLFTLLLPVLAHGAASISFYYNEGTGYLSGGVYTADPDGVTVERIDQSGDITNLTGEVSPYAITMYDDNNVPYEWKNYKVHIGANTTKQIKVTEGEQEYILDQEFFLDPFGGGGSFSYVDASVILDVYRMVGAEHFSGKKAGSFLARGDKLFTFTPEVEGLSAIQLTLPVSYSNQQYGSFNPDVTVASDFLLTDTSVSQSVYAVELYPATEFNNKAQPVNSTNKLILEFSEPLHKGTTYELALSATSGGDEIKLPIAGEQYHANIRYGEYVAYVDGNGYVHNYIFSKNVAGFNNVRISSGETAPSGGSSGYTNVGIITDANKDKQIVGTDSLINGKDGIVSVAISADKPQVLLPINASESIGNNKLRLDSEDLTIEIPTTVLSKLQALLPAAQLEGAQISFDFSKVAESAVTELLNKAQNHSNSGLRAAGDVYDFSISVVTKDGNKTELSQFDEPVTIRLKVNANANKSLLGVYYISNEGKLEYVGGTWVGDELQANIFHFSKYAVLEYNKSYTDVAAGYWAADIIKELSAKHIVQGVSQDLYAPQAEVTRAEFAAMLVRALGLKSSRVSSFTDVSTDAWYAEAVAAASQAGIVQGKSSSLFAPNAKITREEMSALLVRAYELKSGNKLPVAAESKFADRSDAANWALTYIDAAYEAGFVQGRGGNQFAPKAQLTRAESAKAIYTLIVSK